MGRAVACENDAVRPLGAEKEGERDGEEWSEG